MADSFVNSIKLLTAVTVLAAPAGVTVRQLMACLNISRRTVFRLLSALEELGVPLTDEQTRREKTYRLLDSYTVKLPNMAVPNPGLTREETDFLLALLDVRYAGEHRRTNGSGEDTLPAKTLLINSIRHKLTALLPKAAVHLAEQKEVVA